MKKVINFFTFKRVLIIVSIVTAIIALSMLDTCRNNKFAGQQAIIDSLTLANQKLVQDTNRLGQLLLKQPVLIVEDQKALKALALENLNLKARDAKRIEQVNALIIENIELRLANRFLPFDSANTVYIDTTKPCPPNAILTPKKITDTATADFKFYATLEKDGLRIDSLSFPDKQTIALVETKGGFFKRNIEGRVKFYTPKTMEVFVTHTNKHLQVTGMTSSVYSPKVGGRWLERAAIIAATAILTIKVLK